MEERTLITLGGVLIAYLAGVLTNLFVKRQEGQDARVLKAEDLAEARAIRVAAAAAEERLQIVTQWQIINERQALEIRELRDALAAEMARADAWRALWNETFQAGKAALVSEQPPARQGAEDASA